MWQLGDRELRLAATCTKLEAKLAIVRAELEEVRADIAHAKKRQVVRDAMRAKRGKALTEAIRAADAKLAEDRRQDRARELGRPIGIRMRL